MSCPDRSPDEPLTIDEFERLPEEDLYKLELVRGMVVREPRPGPRHGRMGMKLGRHLDEYAEHHDLGLVFTDAGFALYRDPDTIRGPDLSFVSKQRLPAPGYSGTFWRLAPDLAVEILSPSNRPREIREKIEDYFGAGSRLVWVVDPERHQVTVHRAGREPERLGPDDLLSGDDVLPGFELSLGTLFNTP
jgi:Uma2 family endonuclease